MEHVIHYRKQVEELVAVIKDLQSDVERLAKPFRHDPVSGKEPDFNKWTAEDWRRNVFGNALVRLGQLIENNFWFIETMGVLAVARYVFELSVWLHLFQKDSRYALVYYRELLETQRKYCEDTAAQLHREVALLKRFETMDNRADQEVIRAYKEGTVSDAGEMMRSTMERVDAEASRNFSLYLDEAKKNGYGFQAYLVEKKAIPPVERAIANIAKEMRAFESRVPQDVQNLVKGRWQWKRMAEEAGLAHEHDYIYAFASKLLHATPASLTTDKKNLKLPEICIFLRYTHVKILEIMGLARLQPECKLKTLS
jgi:hypothetical protein